MNARSRDELSPVERRERELRREWLGLREQLGPYRQYFERVVANTSPDSLAPPLDGVVEEARKSPLEGVVEEARELAATPGVMSHPPMRVREWIKKREQAIVDSLPSVESGSGHGTSPENWDLSRPFGDTEAAYRVAATFGERRSFAGDDGDDGSDGASRTFYIIDTGRTGAPKGRPRHGTKDPQKATQKLLEHCDGTSLDQLRGCLRRGRPTAEVRQVRSVVEAAVFQVLQKRSATREALASALACDVKTIDRLREAGERASA